MKRSIDIYDDYANLVGVTNTNVPKEMDHDQDAYNVACDKALVAMTRWVKVNRKGEALDYFAWDWA